MLCIDVLNEITHGPEITNYDCMSEWCNHARKGGGLSVHEGTFMKLFALCGPGDCALHGIKMPTKNPDYD